ncbi:MAG: hypothetical protein JW759_07550 [Candidatus Coatesbacteria bacterium]|nr:hypothetical protein [Candidatus Coatesbacteria bacterium]
MAVTRDKRQIFNLIGASLLVLLITGTALAASVETMPVSEIKPGMTGYCLTTLKGFEPERLGIEILGVMHGIVPQGDRILFTGTDEKFKRFGILAGMSGSPCYIDDRLIGALAYAWEAEKEPIGGITPIEEMLTVLDAPAVSQSRPGSGGLFAAQAAGAEPYLDERGRFRLPLRMEPPGSRSQTDAGLEVSEAVAAGNPLLSRLIGTTLAPMPLSFVSSSKRLNDFAGELGFSSVESSASSPVHIDPEQLRPGCPLGEAIITGDLDWSGMGTLTYMDGDTILAYGHSSFGGGSVSYPMCSGIVHAGLPSYWDSFKITSASQPLGVITQDRYPAIAGKIGAKPDMLPTDVWLTDADSGKTRKFHFDIIRNRLFTPFLLALVGEYSVYAFQHDSGNLTIDWDILINVEGRPPVSLQDSYSDSRYSYRTFISYLREPFVAVIDNGFEDVRLESVEMRLKVGQLVDMANIASVDVDRKQVRAGESVRLNVSIQPFEGKKETLSFAVPIPRCSAPGQADLMVFGADAYQMWELLRARARFEARSYTDVVDMLIEAPSHRRLLVVVARRGQPVMRGRETLPDLPASAGDVLSSSASSKTLDAANFEILTKLTFDTAFNLSGKEMLRLQIDPRKY